MYASSMSGSCITSSLTSGSANVAASAVAVSTLNANMASYLPLAGGTIAGNVVVGGTLYASNVNAIAGYTSTYAYENHSSNLVINNAGTGPALLVTQSETGPMGAQPVAQFFNGAGTAALVIDNNGNVGVNRPTALAELDVSGVIAAFGLSGCITNSFNVNYFVEFGGIRDRRKKRVRFGECGRAFVARSCEWDVGRRKA